MGNINVYDKIMIQNQKNKIKNTEFKESFT